MVKKYDMKKEKKLKEIHPHIWELYKHVYESRKRIEERIGYLLAITTLFLIGYIEFFKEEIISFELISIPFFMFSISALILFFSFITKKMWIPWFKKEEITNHIDNNEFYQKSFEEMIVCESDTYNYVTHKDKILKAAYFFDYLAVITLIIILFNSINEKIVLKIVISIMIGIIGLFYLCFIFKKNKEGYADHKNSDEIRKFFDDWLKK